MMEPVKEDANNGDRYFQETFKSPDVLPGIPTFENSGQAIGPAGVGGFGRFASPVMKSFPGRMEPGGRPMHPGAIGGASVGQPPLSQGMGRPPMHASMPSFSPGGSMMAIPRGMIPQMAQAPLRQSSGAIGPVGLTSGMNSMQIVDRGNGPQPPMPQTPPRLPNPGASEFVPQQGAEFVPRSTMGQEFLSPQRPMLRGTTSSPALASHFAQAPASNNSPVRMAQTSNSPLLTRRDPSVSMTPLQTSMGPGGDAPDPGGNIHQEATYGGTTYYMPHGEVPQNQAMPSMAPDYVSYPGPLPHHAHMKFKPGQTSYFMADDVRQMVLDKMSVTQTQPSLHPNQPALPIEVDNYKHLWPLEPPPNPMQKSHRFGYPSTVFRATNVKENMVYCLRRIHGFRHVNQECLSVIEQWKKVHHSNIVQLRQVFTTKAFGDHSLCFVHDFHPRAETLMRRHFSNTPNGFPYKGGGRGERGPGPKGGRMPGGGGGGGPVPEQLLWCYIVQLTSAVRTIHNNGLAARCIDPTKILVVGKHRLWLNCMGVLDVMNYDSANNSQQVIQYHQQEDMVSLGKVILALACHSLHALQRDALEQSKETVARHYTADLKHLIDYLLRDSGRMKNVNEVMPMIGARFYMQLDAAFIRQDLLEAELMKEVECGRLFRLLTKLGTILDRPEFQLDNWSETGERYMLKLFRDYMLHMVDDNGQPWVDMSHIVTCLNKLDSGSEERLSLMSSDSQSVLVVSFKELNTCLAKSFNQLLHPTQPGPI